MSKHLDTKHLNNDLNNNLKKNKQDKDNAASVKPESSSTKSVADNVDKHLQSLENSSRVAQQRQLSPEEQLFTEEELARLVNPDKLKALMSNGDDFLGYLTGEIDKFED
ncbi:hypothetical protein [Psychrobacter sp. FDAARGOS_221]|uniref:hypothetical protein n=1 Tax=Psychrobacter sp. FDAARGOS_221 TaxID=1975705 RepID=UPI000BB58CD4|nr:hypothetical protein [Psychrobacter sp. FDAARGOS_221]PNK61195.1 hypothetical protein A6J60_010145 [Psychrobacter sp. FDAARGOS_221]